MEDVDSEKIGVFIIKMRREKGLSQNELADLLHVSTRTLRHWEKGESLPSMQDVVNLCNIFDVTLLEVFEGKTNKERFEKPVFVEVNEGVKQVNDTVARTDIVINRLEKKVSKLYEEKNDQQKYLLKLLLVHMTTAVLNFYHFTLGPMTYVISLIVTVLYLCYLLVNIIKNRDKVQILISSLMYLLVSLVNAYIVMLSYDSTYSYLGYVEMFLFNGTLYGFIIFKAFDIIRFLQLSIVSYLLMIVLCGTLLWKKAVFSELI